MIVESERINLFQLEAIPRDINGYKRYQIMALSRNAVENKTISEFIGCDIDLVVRWSNRLDVKDKQRNGRPPIYNDEIKLKTIAFYCQTTPLNNCGRWSLRWAETYLKNCSNPIGHSISHSTIQRILKANSLKPHLSKYFLQIMDSDFFPKMERLIKLYRNHPENLYCFDECPGIQVLQRFAPDLQTEKMKKRLEEFEYIRHGTMDVFAFLKVNSGNIFAECRADHKIQTLLEVFEKHLKTCPANEPIHYIMDNLASHASYDLCKLVAKYSQLKCPPEKDLESAIKRREWLQAEEKRIVFHYTPFHGSWLNMVEIWFGILNRKCLKQSFVSPENMLNSINSFIHEWNTLLAHPFKWNYNGKGLHQKAVNRFVKMLEEGTEKMSIKFITKQLILMGNLVQSYWDEVKLDIWIELYKKISFNIKQLNSIISKDDGPKRKEKAKIALDTLIQLLHPLIVDTQKINA